MATEMVFSQKKERVSYDEHPQVGWWRKLLLRYLDLNMVCLSQQKGIPPRDRNDAPGPLSRSSAIGSGKAETMRAKQSKENERAFSRPSFLLFDSEWFFNRSRRFYYLFLLLVLITCRSW